MFIRADIKPAAKWPRPAVMIPCHLRQRYPFVDSGRSRIQVEIRHTRYRRPCTHKIRIGRVHDVAGRGVLSRCVFNAFCGSRRGRVTKIVLNEVTAAIVQE